jgi:hypothetical protein
MQKTKTIICVLIAIASTAAFAQTAFRCDEGGKTVYSEKPCATAQVVAPTQDTDAQRKQTEKANAQMRADNAAVNRDIQLREQSAAKSRSAAQQKTVTKKIKSKKVKTKKETSKIKVAKTKAAKKSKKADNRMSKSS